MNSLQFASWVSAEAQAFASNMAEEVTAPADIKGARIFYDAFNRRHLETALQIYSVEIAEDQVAGVPVHVVTPKGGFTSPQTLICLHGGAFMWGSGAGALVEAVPVAALSGMKVIAVDYRLAPEHVYPAAVDDALSVYLEICGGQPAAGIGIYGASAGAMLTGQLVARVASQGRPVPGAIAMLHGAPIDFDGDSALFADSFGLGKTPITVPTLVDFPYFLGADLDDPLVLPGRSPALLGHFPPSLLITGTRDFAAGATMMMQRRLLAAGIDANLVVFDGTYHSHHVVADLPEAREANQIVADFFKKRLT